MYNIKSEELALQLLGNMQELVDKKGDDGQHPYLEILGLLLSLGNHWLLCHNHYKPHEECLRLKQGLPPQTPVLFPVAAGENVLPPSC
jgi:hypothetical protein